MDKVHIALVANDRYRPGLECTKASMLRACATPERLVFHEYGDKDMEPFLGRVPMEDYNGSKLTYLRLFLPELLPECDWVIYSDVDTLWFRDPCEMWAERDDSVSVCWAKDFPTGAMDFERWAAGLGLNVKVAGTCACAGVMLINLRKWRMNDFTGQAIEFLRKYGCPPYPDQCVMNVLFANDAKMLRSEWDVLIPPCIWRPCVLHIAGMGVRLFGADVYEGKLAQYVFWINYYRKYIRHLPPQELRFAQRAKFVLFAALNFSVGPVLALLDSFKGPYGWKVFLMRVRRRLGFARYALMKV